MSDLRFSITERGAGSTISIPTQGGEITLNDAQACSAALEEIREDGNDTNWVLFAYSEDSTTELNFVGQGTGGVNELVENLTNDSIAYGLIRVTDYVDEIPTTRYAYLTFIGDNVSGIKQAKIAINKSGVTSFIGHYNVELFYSDVADISEEVLMGKIQDASGSRIREKERWPEGKVVVKEQSSSNSNSSSNTSSKPKSAVPTGNFDTVFDDVDKVALQDVRNDNTDTNWCMFTVNKDNKSVSFEASGNGGLEELTAALNDSDVHYCFLRQDHLVDNTSLTVKFLFITWIGPGVKAMRKGRLTTLRGAVVEYFEPYHAEIQAADKDEIDQATVTKRLEEKSG